MYYAFPLYPEFTTLMKTTPTTQPKLWTTHARDIFRADKKGGEGGVNMQQGGQGLHKRTLHKRKEKKLVKKKTSLEKVRFRGSRSLI